MVLLLTFPCLTLRRVYCLPKTRYREVRFLNTDICIYMCLSLIVYLKLWTFLDGGALLFVKEKEIAPSILGFLCFYVNILVIVYHTDKSCTCRAFAFWERPRYSSVWFKMRYCFKLVSFTPAELHRVLEASSYTSVGSRRVLLQVGESVLICLILIDLN